MKYTIIFAVAVLLASCTSVKSTSQSVDVPAKVSSYPTVADLHVYPQRVSRSTSWKWNPFNTTTLKARKGNLKAELVNEAGADIIVEPEFVQRTSLFNLNGGSLTVSGYPAKLDNFRPATPADIAALQAAGMVYGKGEKGGKEVYLVLSDGDISGMVIGKVPSEEVAAVTENVTNEVASANSPAAESPVATAPASTSPADTHTARPKTNIQTTTVTNSQQPSINNQQPSANSHKPVSVNSHKPVAPIAYDAIGTARFLTTIAKEYYGNPNFWPYIYEENKAKFGHPDRIKPGTTVVVPNLNKYGVNPKNPEDVEKAKQLGKEIYARYGKYI